MVQRLLIFEDARGVLRRGRPLAAYGPCLKFKIKGEKTGPAQREEFETAMKQVQEKVPVEEGQKQVRKLDHT